MFPGQPSLATITFMRGDAKKAGALIGQRVLEIAKANPWLRWRLQGTDVVVVPMDTGSPESPMGNLFEQLEEGAVPLTRNTPYDKALALVAPHLGLTAAGKGQVPVFKVLVVPEMSDGFAIVVYLSHRLGDGSTFYADHNMLSSQADIVQLNAQRNLEAPRQIEEAMGGTQNAGFLTALPPILG